MQFIQVGVNIFLKNNIILEFVNYIKYVGAELFQCIFKFII